LPAFSYQVSSTADTTVPTSPSNVSATALGAASAKLTWQAGTDNTGVAGYKILQNNSSIYYPTSTSYIIRGLLPSTTYSYTIQTFDHKWNLSAPVTVSLTTPAIADTVAPSPAGNVNITSITDHSLTLSWSPAHDNVGVICYLVSGPFLRSNDCITPTGTTYSFASNSIPAFYKGAYNVVAFDADGNLSQSDSIFATTALPGDPSAPTAPQQLYIAYHTINGTMLTWQPSTDDKTIAGYNIYRGCCKIAFTTNMNSYFDPIPQIAFYRAQAVDSDGSLSPLINTSGFEVNGGGSAGNTTPPAASIVSPAAGATLSGTVTLQSTTTDTASTVSQVQYFIDGKFVNISSISSAFPLTIDTTRYSDGPHWLLVEALDLAGNAGTSGPINVTFNNNGNTQPADTTPPTVSITSPASGATVSGSQTVAANASDNAAVSKVDFLVDGSLAASDTSSPYGFSWDTTKITNGSHSLTANAYDSSNNVSSSSVVVNTSNGDTTPPSAPTSLRATAAAYNQVNLSWNPSTDNVGVSGYYIVKGGTTIAQTTGTGTGFTDSTVNASTSYSYQVMAYDAAGNSSALSNIVSVITPSVPDTTAPSTPVNLTAVAVSSSQVNLSWNPSTDNIGVSAYDIYRNSSKVASVSGATTNFGDAALAASTSYSYYVVARDAAGNSSVTSNTVTAATQPNPPATTGNLSGTVSSSKGGSLPGATISIRYSGSNHSFSSDSLGNYFINSIPPGSYTVKYTKSGFTSKSLTVSITASTTTTENVMLVSRK
jgi:chitodextrinase